MEGGTEGKKTKEEEGERGREGGRKRRKEEEGVRKEGGGRDRREEEEGRGG